jgi:two-component system response regulator HydG
MVKDRHFREDLYFRIKGVTIQIPPLRERREDNPLLLYYFLKQSAERYGKAIEGIKPLAQQALMSFSWPGNVRQLKNVIENMVVLSPEGDIGPEVLPKELSVRSATVVGGVNHLAGLTAEQVEREHIRQTLEMVHGNREQAAKLLGMGERTLYRKIKDYGLGEAGL